jgi:bifunctional UDP-N-acetylglucosamine pyrophosphorylase/glucosamine-1-phosphate N-acetyltransferase
MDLSVVILSAGQGKRMRSELPKVLQLLAGRPLLAHVLDVANELSPRAIHVVYGHGGDRVREEFANRDVSWVLQAEQLGTAHAVRQAMPSIDPDDLVLMLYGDVPLATAGTLRALVDAAAPGGLALLTARLSDPTGYGRIIRDGAGEVAAIVEEGDADQEQRRIREINTGLMACQAGTLAGWLERVDAKNAQREFYLTDVVTCAVADGAPVTALTVDAADEVLGINDRRQLAEAERIYRARVSDELLDHGVTLADPHRIDVRGSLSCGRDVFIDINVVFEGEVRLGDGVRVGPNTVIRDCEIGAGSTIHPSCVLESSSIGKGCEVGPFARLRPQAELADTAKVGNFVEIKKSQIGPGSKVNHLTYIGDTTIGERVNVGAGTITCNYDGANKHRTIIGDGAFIGSGVELVAPVEIGAGATIGAGSTISKFAPPGELMLERSKQVVVRGWKRPVKKSE